MKNLTITLALAAGLLGTIWAEPTWPTEDAEINLNNRRISTFYKDGTTWAHRSDVAGALGLEKEGEEMVDLQAACQQHNVNFSTRANGTVDVVVHKASAGAPVSSEVSPRPRSYSGSGYHGSYSGSSSSSSRSKNGGHTKNYTPYSSQSDEYFNTHKANGRVFNLSTGQYVTGQENRVYVDGYTTKSGTVVNPVTRSYPSGSSRSTGSSYNYRSNSSSRPSPNSTSGRPPLSEMKQGTGYPGQAP